MNAPTAGLLGALFGAALTATAFLLLAPTPAVPGDRATPATADRAPDTPPAPALPAADLAAENALLKARLAKVEAQVDQVVAGVDQLSALKAQRATLAAELEAAKATAAQEAEARRDTEGEPLPFPADLPAEFRQEGLRAALAQALADSGLDATVDAVDCSEFPCIAYGHAQRAWDDREALDAAFRDFTGALGRRWPEADHQHHTSVWAGKGTLSDGSTVKRTSFGLAVYPKGFADGQAGDLRKRLRFRQQQYNEATAD
ncbi:MAG: hypothetical protein H6702_22150 [Myxococcales bacterium]|nr:hypothetical protein [Myxococcales bacterium]